MRDDGQSLSDEKRCYSSLWWNMWYENSRSMYLLRKDNIDFAFVSTAPTHILHSLLKTPSGSIYFKCLCFVRRREVYRWLSFLYKTIYFHSASVKQELKLLLGNNYYNLTELWDGSIPKASIYFHGLLYYLLKLLQTSVLKIGTLNLIGCRWFAVEGRYIFRRY